MKLAMRTGSTGQAMVDHRWLRSCLTATPNREMLAIVSYPGGKSGDGVYQRIVNLLPPHDVYIEPFLGGGAIMRLKKAAGLNIGLDLDGRVIERWKASIDENGDARGGANFRFHCADAITFLRVYPFTGRELIYCDPPYVMSARRGCRRRLYRFEMNDEQHAELLTILKALPCRIAISGYWSELYGVKLSAWRHLSFRAMTRGGPATEHLWLNFPESAELHDYRFLGHNFRERERIARRRRRWIAKIRRMSAVERNALVSALVEDIASAEIASGPGLHPLELAIAAEGT